MEMYGDTRLCSDIDVDDHHRGIASDLRISVRGSERDILARAGHDLDDRLPELGTLPVQILQERGMVATPVHEGVGDSRICEGLEKDGGSSVHLST